MTSQPELTLYHVTNRVSVEAMLKSGIGLDLNDYEQMYLKIKNYLNVPIEATADLFTENTPEYEGAVWFYSTQKEALRNIHLSSEGGVYKHRFIKGLISHSARLLGVPYTQLQDLEETLTGGLSEPVMVMVRLPSSLLVQPSKTGPFREFRTKNKVPAEHICKVISCL